MTNLNARPAGILHVVVTENPCVEVTISKRSHRVAKSLVISLAAAGLAAGCATRPAPAEREPVIGDEEAGQILGGVAGAAAGSQIGEGSGQTIATVAGALIGSVIGERLGARADRDDYRRTASVLESNDDYETTEWENPRTANEFAVTPVNTWSQDGRSCREFRFRVETPRGTDTRVRTACRQPDGTWEILD